MIRQLDPSELKLGDEVCFQVMGERGYSETWCRVIKVYRQQDGRLIEFRDEEKKTTFSKHYPYTTLSVRRR